MDRRLLTIHVDRSNFQQPCIIFENLNILTRSILSNSHTWTFFSNLLTYIRKKILRLVRPIHSLFHSKFKKTINHLLDKTT